MTLDDVIAGARRSMAISESARWQLARGSGRSAGARARHVLASGPDGACALWTDGPLSSAWGGMPSEGWQRDASGLTRPLEPVEWALSRLVGLVISGRWMMSMGSAIKEVALVGGATGASHVAVRITPTDGAPAATLVLARETWLPITLECRRPFGLEMWRFDRGRIVQELPGGFIANEIEFDGPSVEDASAADLCRRPPTGAPDATWDRDAPPSVEVQRAPMGFLLATVCLNDDDPITMALDSGAAVNVITPDAAAAKGLESIGLGWINPMTGPASARRWRADALRIGPLALQRAWFTEMDLAPLSAACGREIAGVLGYDLFARSIVDLDLSGPRLALHDPDTFRLDHEDRWQPLSLYSNRPHVTARFGLADGGEASGLFRLDSGAPRLGAILNRPTVERHRLDTSPRMVRTTLRLPGGAVEAAVGLVPWIELNGVRVVEPRIVCVVGAGTAFDDEVIAGNLGQGVLATLRIVFDFKRRQIAVSPCQ